MSLPGEVLPQLLLGSALSAQAHVQGGLWIVRKGTRDCLFVCFSS